MARITRGNVTPPEFKYSTFRDWITDFNTCFGGIWSRFDVLVFSPNETTKFNGTIVHKDSLEKKTFIIKSDECLLLRMQSREREPYYNDLPSNYKVNNPNFLYYFYPEKSSHPKFHVYPCHIQIMSKEQLLKEYKLVCSTNEGIETGCFDPTLYNFKNCKCIGLYTRRDGHLEGRWLTKSTHLYPYELMGHQFDSYIDYSLSSETGVEYFRLFKGSKADSAFKFDPRTGELQDIHVDKFPLGRNSELYMESDAYFSAVSFANGTIPGIKRIESSRNKFDTALGVNIIEPEMFFPDSTYIKETTPRLSREVNAYELVSDIFQFDKEYTQNSNEKENGKGNPIIYVNSEHDHKNMAPKYPTVLFKDKAENILSSYPDRFSYALINNCTYFGGKKDNKKLDKCFGITQEIDNMSNRQLETFLQDCRAKRIPTPNYITFSKSGTGVHLYYLFDNPVKCKWWNDGQLKLLKKQLCTTLWNARYSDIPPQKFQPYVQSFMLPGFTFGCRNTECTRTFALRNTHYSLDELCNAINFEWLNEKEAKEKFNLYPNAKHSLEYCKKHYPKWYQKVIVEKRLSKTYNTNPGFYHWFLNKLKEPGAVRAGHRYYAIGALAIIGIKCNIPLTIVKKDADELFPIFNRIEGNPFYHDELELAINHFYKQENIRVTREKLSEYSGIDMPKNKRNYRTREEHMNWIQKERNKKYSGNWRKKWGRKKMVTAWARKNEPTNGKYNRSQCAKELGISRRTAITYLTQIEYKELKDKLFSNESSAVTTENNHECAIKIAPSDTAVRPVTTCIVNKSGPPE